MLRFFGSRLNFALFLVVLVLSTGVLGYRFLSHFSWLDAFYMTVITVTTVGFSEVGPMDADTKIFTVFLIISSVFIFAFAISVITEYILSRNSQQLLKKKKLEQKVDRITDHVILCGYGRNGNQAAQRLKAYNRPFVVIEKDKEIVEKNEGDVLFIEGDANDDEILLAAGIERAKCLIAAMPDDAANLFVVLSARQLNKSLFIISRASLITTQKKLLLAGADKVIMPDKIGGDHMASLVVIPDLITFMDKLSMEGGNSTNLEEVAIEEFVGQTEFNSLRDLDIRRKTGCTIIGYIEPGGNYIINPEAELRLQPKSKIIVLGRPEQIKKLHEIFNID